MELLAKEAAAPPGRSIPWIPLPGKVDVAHRGGFSKLTPKLGQGVVAQPLMISLVTAPAKHPLRQLAQAATARHSLHPTESGSSFIATSSTMETMTSALHQLPIGQRV